MHLGTCKLNVSGGTSATVRARVSKRSSGSSLRKLLLLSCP